MAQPKNAGREAQEQAKAYNSIFAPRELTLDDGTVIEVPPHPRLRMLDDDVLATLEELDFETESYDRGPEVYIPEQKVKDRAGNDMVLAAETRPGPLLLPYRKDGKLIKPPYSVRVAEVALGDDYLKLRAGKVDGHRGSAADVWRIWSEQSLEVTEREGSDTKSDGSTDDLADVPTPDGK